MYIVATVAMSAVIGFVIGVLCGDRVRLAVTLAIFTGVACFIILGWGLGDPWEWSWQHPIASAAYLFGLLLFLLLPVSVVALFVSRLLAQPPLASTTADARAHRLLGCFAVAHGALAVLTVFAALWFDYGLPYLFQRCWVAWVTTWLVWPLVLLLHRGRSVLRIAVPLLLGLLLLVPCAPCFLELAPRVFAGTARMPTLDRPNVVENESLGGGFRRVALEEFMTGGFESIYHGEYLYYGKRQLSYFVSSSLSPGRKFAAYAADQESGLQGDQDGFHVFVFRAADQQIFRVTPERVYYVGEFKWEWDEAAGHLFLHFKDGRPPGKFLLPTRA